MLLDLALDLWNFPSDSSFCRSYSADFYLTFSSASRHSQGNVTAEVMNELGYDLATIGNHEWDNGPENLGQYWPKLKFPIVCANVDLTKYPELDKWVKPYHIFEDLGIAVIGYITNVKGPLF